MSWIRKIGLAALPLLISAALAGGVAAQEGKGDGAPPAEKGGETSMGCAYCDAVAHVMQAMHAMRCPECPADKQCGRCMELAKKCETLLKCDSCGAMKDPSACKECKAAAAHMAKASGDCKFCAEKKMLSEHMYCCKKCKSGGMVCPKCEEMRQKVMAVTCKDCAAKKKG